MNRPFVGKYVGDLPQTVDRVHFGMGANLWVKLADGRLVEAGVLSIADPDDRHHEDYPDGQRWNIRVRTASGHEYDVNEGSLYLEKP